LKTLDGIFDFQRDGGACQWGHLKCTGMQVLLSVAEHHSNLVPWQLVCQATGATLKHVPLTKDGRDLDMQVMHGLSFHLYLGTTLGHFKFYVVYSVTPFILLQEIVVC
jgi:hypothetical protein